MFTIGFPLLVLLIAAGLIVLLSRTKDEKGESRIRLLLGTKIMGSFSLLVLVLVTLSVYSINSLGTIGDHVEEMSEEVIPITNIVATIQMFQLEQVIALERVFRFAEQGGTMPGKKLKNPMKNFSSQAAKSIRILKRC